LFIYFSEGGDEKNEFENAGENKKGRERSIDIWRGGVEDFFFSSSPSS
jgi:hypothetical protein